MVVDPSEPTLAQTVFWIAGTIAFVTTTLAAILAWPKYRRELNAREWDRAHQAYEKFLEVAIANPEFVPRYWSMVVSSAEQKNKYRWFMAHFLWAAEQALLRVQRRHRSDWEQAIRVMLREHSDFISSPEARDEVDCYYGSLKQLIREVINEVPRVQPPPPAPSPTQPV